MNQADLFPESSFRFDPEAHRYYLGKQELPSVSRILRPLAAYPERDPAKVKEAMEWGTQVHALTEQWETGTLPPFDSVPSEQRACVDAWTAAMHKLNAKSVHIETRVYHPRLLYAGTIDRVALVDDALAIIDIKTGGLHPWYDAQVAAYAMAWEAMADEQVERLFLVNLRGDGSFAFRELGIIERERGWTAFRAALHILRTHEAWGLKPLARDS